MYYVCLTIVEGETPSKSESAAQRFALLQCWLPCWVSF